ncbi:hypothetical protein N9137_01620 [Pseudomonadales bacterium]|nr:hypothetical protein [Pseudomonadales bacterium]
MAITKLISILSALAFSNMALGQQVPNTFQPGNPIVASEVNANFDALEAEIAVLKAQVETLQSTSGNALPQYVGVSSGTIDGGQGIRAMTELCHADYPGSRMCMTEEYVKTSNFPTAEAGASAWINPSQLVADSDGWTDNYTGIFLNTPYKLNCRAWGSSSSGSHESGTRVQAGGSFSNTFCNSVLPVACCK